MKAHPFFASVDWRAMEEKKVPPPWRPSLSGDTDTSYFSHKYTYTEMEPAAPSVGVERACERSRR